MPEKVLSLLSPAVKVFVLAILIVPAPLIEATVSSEFTLYVAPELTATGVESDNVPEIAKVPAVRAVQQGRQSRPAAEGGRGIRQAVQQEHR